MVKLMRKVEVPEFIPVDEWMAVKSEKMINDKLVEVTDYVLNEEDKVFKQIKRAIILPVSEFYGIEDNNTLDYFILTAKRCYHNDTIRLHCTHYLNYFEKFYDTERELVSIYYNLKPLIDCVEGYTKDALIYDLKKYILSNSILHKVRRMNRDNYTLKLNYKIPRNPGLQYTDKHGMILMEISLLMNMVIPLVTHYMYVHNIQNTTDFLLEIFEIIIHMHDDVDMYNKLYETAVSNIEKDMNENSPLWERQNIRGKSATTHALDSVINIIINIMPKYKYDQNIVIFNFRSIVKNIGFQITDISWEYSFISLSSSKRDIDQNSEFDKFESQLSKADESLYIQNKVNCEETMKAITMRFGPFDDEEIAFYMRELGRDSKSIINAFQKDLIFNLFFKYFGDPVSIRAINKEDYVKLMIVAKRILEASGMVLLPYIISSKITRLTSRKNINKKELQKLESSPFYPNIKAKYKNDKIERHILSIIAQIIASDFQIIDYQNPDLHGKMINTIPEYICEEIIMYISLI